MKLSKKDHAALTKSFKLELLDSLIYTTCKEAPVMKKVADLLADSDEDKLKLFDILAEKVGCLCYISSDPIEATSSKTWYGAAIAMTVKYWKKAGWDMVEIRKILHVYVEPYTDVAKLDSILESARYAGALCYTPGVIPAE